jgi:NitT/TauT family transport system substrate-binding protein
LKGKTVGTFSVASPDKISSRLAVKQGIDPVKDIEWRSHPADQLGVALKGEIQAFSGPVRWSRSSATETIY